MTLASESTPRVSLEQWRTLRAIVDAGGYAQAAERLHKSQSSITYAVQKLERLLGVKVFIIDGRRAMLTQAGNMLLRRAGALVDEAAALEAAASRLAAGWEPEIRLAADTMFPTWLLLRCLDDFAKECPTTRIELMETVLGGTYEGLRAGNTDLAIGPIPPPGFVGDPLIRLRFIAVASPDHPLHALERDLTPQDLRQHRQLVIRDSGRHRAMNVGWLGSEQRWTVSHKATSIRAACMGLGFAWYPEHLIREELASGALKPLPLREGGERYAQLYLVIPDIDYAGLGVRRLATLIMRAAKQLDT